MKRLKIQAAVFAGALLCCFLWASAFPGIKIGYRLWGIQGSDTWRIIRFAGVRFFLAGFLVILSDSQKESGNAEKRCNRAFIDLDRVINSQVIERERPDLLYINEICRYDPGLPVLCRVKILRYKLCSSGR